MSRYLLIVGLVVVLLGGFIAGPSAVAEDCVFVAPQQENGQAFGDWHVAENWNTGRVPTAEDHIIIPAESWCLIQPDDEDHPNIGAAICHHFTITKGGRLTNLQNTLVVGSDTEVTRSVVDGVLDGREPDGYPPSAKIIMRGIGSVGGTGIIDCSRANGPDYHLSFRCCGQGLGPCDYKSELLTFEDGLTLRGHIRFNGICLKMNALALVDHSDDVMELMPSGGQMICGGLCHQAETVTGHGRFVVVEGVLQIGSPHFRRCGKPAFELAGNGQILVSEDAGCEFKVSITPAAGTLAIAGLDTCTQSCSKK